MADKTEKKPGFVAIAAVVMIALDAIFGGILGLIIGA